MIVKTLFQAFSHFINGLQKEGHPICCGTEFSCEQDLYRHVNSIHNKQINSETERILEEGSQDAKWKVLHKKDTNMPETTQRNNEPALPHTFSTTDEFPWLPLVADDGTTSEEESRQILLFYKYK